MINLCLLINSCTRGLVKDDEFSISKQNYNGNELKINGYFYKKYGSPEKLSIYFFYKTGIILLVGDGYEMKDTLEFEQKFKSTEFIKKLREIKFCWGVFKIDDNNISFERWYPSEKPYKAFIRKGQIINDTTFIITEFYKMKNGKKRDAESINETYHFRQFSHKPDCTNTFIP